MTYPMHYAGLNKWGREDADFLGRRDVFFEIPMSRNLAIAILLSLLIHAYFLFGLHRPPELKNPAQAMNMPLDVELAPIKKPAVAPHETPRMETRKILAVNRPASKSQDRIVQEKPVREKQIPEPRQVEQPKMSFLDYVNAMRQRRDAGSNDYPQAAPAVGPSPPSEKPEHGTSGIFQIIRIDDNSAEFSFRGWHSEYSNSHKEVFDVDAPDGHVRLAVVRKMIEIIRRYYKGDFNWDSERLGSVVVLSARPKDNKALETFMMKEFFNPS